MMSSNSFDIVSPTAAKTNSRHGRAKVEQQLNQKKCLNEKKRREQESIYMEELAEYITSSDMSNFALIKQDKCAILHETINQLRSISDQDGDDVGCDVVSSTKSTADILSNDVVAPLLLEALDGFLFMINAASNVTFVSENVASFLKFSQDELLGMNLYNLVHEDDHIRLSDFLRKTNVLSLTTNKTCSVDCRLVVCNNDDSKLMKQYVNMQIVGLCRPLGSSVTNSCRHVDGDIVCIARRTTSKMFSSVNIQQFTTKQDLIGNILACDTACPSGQSVELDLVGKDLLELCHENDRQCLSRHHEQVLKNGSNMSGVYRFCLSPEHYVFIQTNSKLFRNPTTNFPEFIMSTHSVVRQCDGASELLDSASSSLMKAIIGTSVDSDADCEDEILTSTLFEQLLANSPDIEKLLKLMPAVIDVAESPKNYTSGETLCTESIGEKHDSVSVRQKRRASVSATTTVPTDAAAAAGGNCDGGGNKRLKLGLLANSHLRDLLCTTDDDDGEVNGSLLTDSLPDSTLPSVNRHMFAKQAADNNVTDTANIALASSQSSSDTCVTGVSHFLSSVGASSVSNVSGVTDVSNVAGVSVANSVGHVTDSSHHLQLASAAGGDGNSRTGTGTGQGTTGRGGTGGGSGGTGTGTVGGGHKSLLKQLLCEGDNNQPTTIDVYNKNKSLLKLLDREKQIVSSTQQTRTVLYNILSANCSLPSSTLAPADKQSDVNADDDILLHQLEETIMSGDLTLDDLDKLLGHKDFLSLTSSAQHSDKQHQQEVHGNLPSLLHSARQLSQQEIIELEQKSVKSRQQISVNAATEEVRTTQAPLWTTQTGLGTRQAALQSTRQAALQTTQTGLSTSQTGQNRLTEPHHNLLDTIAAAWTTQSRQSDQSDPQCRQSDPLHVWKPTQVEQCLSGTNEQRTAFQQLNTSQFVAVNCSDSRRPVTNQQLTDNQSMTTQLQSVQTGSDTQLTSGMLGNTQLTCGMLGNTQSASGMLGNTQLTSGMLGNTQSASGMLGNTQSASGMLGNRMLGNQQRVMMQQSNNSRQFIPFPSNKTREYDATSRSLPAVEYDLFITCSNYQQTQQPRASYTTSQQAYRVNSEQQVDHRVNSAQQVDHRVASQLESMLCAESNSTSHSQPYQHNRNMTFCAVHPPAPAPGRLAPAPATAPGRLAPAPARPAPARYTTAHATMTEQVDSFADVLYRHLFPSD